MKNQNLPITARSRRAAGLRRRTRAAGAAGFSLVEGLVAMAMLLIVVLGLIPLFTQSMINNVAGRHMTMAANFATDSFESRLQMPFNNDNLTIADGNTGLATVEIFAGRTPKAANGTPIPNIETNGRMGSFSLSYATEEPPTLDALLSAANFDQDRLDSTEWSRVSYLTLYQVTALEDGVLDDDERLAGGVFVGFEHLKKIEVNIIPRNVESRIGRGQITATILKAF